MNGRAADANHQSHETWLTGLHAIARILADEPLSTHALQQVLQVLDRELDMSRGTIGLLAADREHVVLEAVHPQTTAPAEPLPRYRRGEGIIGRVVADGQPAVVARPDDEPQFLNRIHRRGADQVGQVSFVCVPIQISGVTVGSLCTDISRGSDEALASRQRLLSVVAAMVAHHVRARQDAVAERSAYEAENLRLRDALGEQFRPESMVGNSPAMHEVYQRIRQLAAVDSHTLIVGEAGNGKQLAARAIHYASERARRPFVPVRCAGIAEASLEAELFGHGRSSQHTATYQRIGLIEQAEGGTIYLDEVGDLSPRLQMKLVRLLQEGRCRGADGATDCVADVRLIAGSTRDLHADVTQGRFREDLFYRINVLPIVIPPLRERRDDIMLLADHFVSRFSQRMQKPIRRISTSAINMLISYHWPGNVRELENCIEQAVLVTRNNVIQGRDLPPSLQVPDSRLEGRTGSLPEQIEALERDMLTDALKRSKGNIAAAARQLGITSRMARYRIKALKIQI